MEIDENLFEKAVEVLEIHDLPNTLGNRDCWLEVVKDYWFNKEFHRYHYTNSAGCYCIERVW